MKKIFDMKQERAEITASIRSIMDEFEAKEMPGEKKDELGKLEAKFDGLNDSITTEEKQLERERLAGEKAGKEEEKPKGEAGQIFAKALTGDEKAINEYKNAYSLGDNDSAGSLTAPMEFVQEIIKELADITVMRQISRIVGPIGAAQTLGFPYRKTKTSAAEWISENAAAAEGTDATYGRREFKPNRLNKLAKISKSLVVHAPMADGVIRSEIAEIISDATENAYMIGDGNGKPLGVFTASKNGISTARDISNGNTATEITFDGLMNAKYAVKQQSRRDAAWIMHRDLVNSIAKIKDADGQYIWQPSVALGSPDILLGAGVYESEFAPNTYTTGKYAAVYGDFKNGYWICDADGMNIQVLVELYALNNQIGYLFDYFGDGAPVLESAFARVKLG